MKLDVPNTQFLFIFLIANLLYISSGLSQENPSLNGAKPFHIKVIDKETRRGVPLVELKTVNDIQLITDSAGNIAFSETDLMNQPVFFHIAAHGYEYPKDGFGYRGVRLRTKPGDKAIIELPRKNIARRLYRITGSGIYRDSQVLGLDTPVASTGLNAQVLGSDSVVNAIYKNRLYWFWGDTDRASYPLGNFQVSGATSILPDKIDPANGFKLEYFKNKSGFAKSMAPIPGKGPTWIFGLFVTQNQTKHSYLVAKYEKIKPPMEAYQRGLVVFDDELNQFKKLVEFDLKAPLFPGGQAFTYRHDSNDYVYFARPFPFTRVVNDYDAIQNPANYEAFSYFKTGVIIESPKKGKTKITPDMLHRDREGRLAAQWRKNTQPISPKLEQEMIQQGILRQDEAICLLAPSDPKMNDNKKQIMLSSGSVAWNQYRKKWIMIAVQAWGTSMLGEIWFAEADRIEGPWSKAYKVVTHNDYSFYNPRHHPYFDRQNGKLIYFEGTYTSLFSGAKSKTARYDYNQMMYELDLEKIPKLQ